MSQLTQPSVSPIGSHSSDNSPTFETNPASKSNSSAQDDKSSNNPTSPLPNISEHNTDINPRLSHSDPSHSSIDESSKPLLLAEVPTDTPQQNSNFSSNNAQSSSLPIDPTQPNTANSPIISTQSSGKSISMLPTDKTPLGETKIEAAEGKQQADPTRTPAHSDKKTHDSTRSPALARARNGRAGAITTVTLLCIINLLNYMDRFTIPGVLSLVKSYYSLNMSLCGLLQTVFITSYMAVSPVFGFLGDRYSRKILILVGIAVWSIVTLASSFVPANMFWLFVIMRGLVGVGEASYCTVATSIIGDLFVGTARTIALILFFLVLPVGSGLGYIIGGQLASIFGEWQWSLRLTPIFGFVLFVITIIFVREPERGAAEREEKEKLNAVSGDTELKSLPLHRPGPDAIKNDGEDKSIENPLVTSPDAHNDTPTSTTATNESNFKDVLAKWWSDILELLYTKSFLFVVLGFTSVAFVAGALSWWAPFYFRAGFELNPAPGIIRGIDDISFIFGAVTCVSGIGGVACGALLAKKLRTFSIIGRKADPLVSALGMFIAVPGIFLAFLLPIYDQISCFLICFIAEIAFCFTWTLTTEVILYVVPPERRATATSIEMLASHLLGDASSPYLVGLIADLVKYSLSSSGQFRPNGNYVEYLSLQSALFMNAFACLLGCGAFLACSLFVESDRAQLDRQVAAAALAQKNGSNGSSPPTQSNGNGNGKASEKENGVAP